MYKKGARMNMVLRRLDRSPLTDRHRMMEELMRPLWEEEFGNNLPMNADVYETDDHIMVEMAAPGVRPEDISINITGDVLTITGETKQEEKEEKRNYYQKQIRYGNFAQQVTLPTPVTSDKAEAHFQNGMLKVSLPKAEEAKPKQIQVKIS